MLTGGKSPVKLYKHLAKTKNIPWEKIDFFISDERYVNENSKYSNIKLCKKFLLNKIKISNNQVHKISTDNISDSTVQIGHFKHFILIIFQTLSLKINTAPQISQRRNGILILFKNSFKTFGIFFPSSVKKIIDFFQ